MYGIYDLSGGLWERTAGYVANGRSQLKSYGSSFTYNGNNPITESTKYAKVYEHDSEKDNVDLGSDASGESTKINAASAANYEKNTHVYGNAMNETSTAGTGTTSWYSDYSYFPGLSDPFSVRGGGWWHDSSAGLFSFHLNGGSSHCISGFRPVVVAM